MSENEAILLNRVARQSDSEAFAELVRRYGAVVYGTGLRVAGNASDAADVTQETFYQLLRNAGRITGSLGGWLHRVATRRAVDKIRRETARRRREHTYAAQEAAAAQAGWPEVSACVDEALEQLSDESREVVVEHFLQGRGMEEMAQARGVSKATVGRRIEAGLGQMREILRNRGVLVAAAGLGTMLAENTASAMPAGVAAELGKIAAAASATSVGGAGTAAASGGLLSSVAAKIAAGVAAAGVTVGAVAVYTTRDKPAPTRVTATQTSTVAAPESAVPTPRREAEPAPKEPAVAAEEAPQAQPTGFDQTLGGEDAMEEGAAEDEGLETPATTEERRIDFSTPENAVHSFMALLERGDVSQLPQCFVPEAEDQGDLMRILEAPASESERHGRDFLLSLGAPVEIVQTEYSGDSVQVKWTATIKRPALVQEHGRALNYDEGQTVELDARLDRIGNEWKLAGI